MMASCSNEDDDFTFPATAATPPPYFFESPPLWQPPPRLKSTEEEEAPMMFEMCSCEECSSISSNYDAAETEIIREEKMDLLWEDLDLDEKCSRINYSREMVVVEAAADQIHHVSPGRNVKICCVKTLKFSKQNGNGLKASILELIRFLMKKGFSMHNNSGNSINKINAW